MFSSAVSVIAATICGPSSIFKSFYTTSCEDLSRKVAIVASVCHAGPTYAYLRVSCAIGRLCRRRISSPPVLLLTCRFLPTVTASSRSESSAEILQRLEDSHAHVRSHGSAVDIRYKSRALAFINESPIAPGKYSSSRMLSNPSVQYFGVA